MAPAYLPGLLTVPFFSQFSLGLNYTDLLSIRKLAKFFPSSEPAAPAGPTTWQVTPQRLPG